MDIIIEKSTACGNITAPPSKSYAHRFLIGAALACGKSKIENVCLSEDIRATIDCARALGAKITFDETSEKSQKIYVHGVNGTPKICGNFFCRESGSTLRFFLPLALLANSLSSGNADQKVVFHGAPRLIERGISVYEEALAFSANFEKRIFKNHGEIAVRGKLLPAKYVLRGNVSSQFFTGFLFALPLLNGNSELKILPPAESADYIEITLKTLEKFDVTIEKTAKNEYVIAGNQFFQAGNFRVEGDFSNAAFLLALNALGGNVNVNGLSEQSLQGDKICIPLFHKLSENFVEADLTNCPDLAPILFAVAAAKHGARFTGTRRLKIKESDRAEAMREELEKFGAKVKLFENAAEIIPPQGGLQAPKTSLCSHGDHRIAMAVSILCTLTGGTVTGAEAVKKSYPDFFEALTSLGIHARLENPKE